MIRLQASRLPELNAEGKWPVVDPRARFPSWGPRRTGPYHVVVCEQSSTGECQHCPAEDITERVREHLLEVMDDKDYCNPVEVQHIAPACVSTATDGSAACCYNAWYWGSCNIKG